MNSALQLLFRIPYLNNYLKQIDLKLDVNCANPMGQNGKISKAFIELYRNVNECRIQKRDYFSPKAFKAEIGKIWPIFKGNDQQDSQELMTLILNALSDELNIMKHEEKYINPEHTMATDLNDISLEAWSQHMYSNWSFISFAFTGMQCSHIECSSCKNISYNFESFMSLSLSIPETKRTEYVPMCLPEMKLRENAIKIIKFLLQIHHKRSGSKFHVKVGL
jgi:ubiquitin C-terminal hydrolase